MYEYIFIINNTIGTIRDLVEDVRSEEDVDDDLLSEALDNLSTAENLLEDARTNLEDIIKVFESEGRK